MTAGAGTRAETPRWSGPAAVAAVVLSVTLVKLWVAGQVDLVADEAYYAIWSLYPQWGYLDHPPMVAWLIGAGRAIAGDGEIGVRLMAVASCGIVAALMYRTGTLMFSRAAAAAAAVWYVFTPAAALGLFVMTPDAPSTLFWMAAIWAIAEMLASGNQRWWLAVGLFAGLGLISKYTVFFLGAGLVAWLLADAERRRWFRRWPLWAGGGLALAVFAPVLWWNATHEWVSFVLQFGRPVRAATDSGGGDFMLLTLGQMAGVLPPVFGLVVAGLVARSFRGFIAARRGASLLGLTSVPALVFFFGMSAFGHVGGNWTMPVLPPLVLLAAGLAFDAAPASAVGRRAVAVAKWSQLPLGVVLVGLLHAQALVPTFTLFGADRADALHGWREMREALTSLAEAEGAAWIATRGGYGQASLFAYYGWVTGDAHPVRALDAHPRLDFLPPLPTAELHGPALVVVGHGTPAVEATHGFAEAGSATMITRDWGEHMRGQYDVYRVTGLSPAAAEGAGLAPR